MSTLGPAEEHLRTFALDQASMIAHHLQSTSVDYTFVARHARTLLELAEDAQNAPRSSIGSRNWRETVT